MSLRNGLMTVLLAGALGVACTQNGSSSGTQPQVHGKVKAVQRGTMLDIDIDLPQTPLAVAMTVTVTAADISGAAALGDAARGRDLFRQNAASPQQLRFAVSDTRALRMQRTGTVLRIPVSSHPTRVRIDDISVADQDGRAMPTDGFDASPETGL